MNWYTEHYLKSLKLKDPELKESFEAERQELDSIILKFEESETVKDRKILEIGCGNGRVLFKLAGCKATFFPPGLNYPVYLIGVDKDPEILDIARARKARIQSSLFALIQGQRKTGDLETALGIRPRRDAVRELLRGVEEVSFYEADAAKSLGFPNSYFDLSFSAYNTLGGMTPEERERVLFNMIFATKPGGKIANVVWKNDDRTKEFLRKRYYPNIGFEVNAICSDSAIVQDSSGKKHTIYRPTTPELVKAYEKAGIEKMEVKPLGPLYKIVTGTKTSR